MIGCPSLTLTPATLNSGVMGVAYSQTLTPSGGSAPYTFNVTGLPSGLTANATPSNVILSGTPIQSGNFTVNVTVTDTYGCTGSQSYPLVISAPQPLAGDVRFSADFNGDGKTDLAIWRASTATFWVYLSASGNTFSKQMGVSTDVPVPGDYDGDGKADLGVWRPSTGVWWILRSSNGVTMTIQWGMLGDLPVR